MSHNAFLAVVPSDSTKLEIKQKLRLPFPPDQVRWVRQHNLHLTLGYIHNLAREDRKPLVQAFTSLSQLHAFKVLIRRPVVLGTGNTLCGLIEPSDELQKLREECSKLLERLQGRYSFDQTYAFLPHVKVQSIRKSLSDDMRVALRDEFMERPFHQIEMKVNHVAWMERAGEDYRIIRSYYLR